MFRVLVSVFVKLTFPIFLVSVKPMVIYVNTDKKSTDANYLSRVQQGFLLTAGNRLKKRRLLALSIEPPSFLGNKIEGW